MNQKELNEIRRRFRLDKSSISRIFGCYVNSNREVISWIDASLGLMSQEESEMYLTLLKKSLSGALGKNLLDIEFSTQQVADSDEHRLLQTLRMTALQDPNARETLCRKIIDSINMGESNYLILLAADAYDVPYRGRDGELQADASDQVFKYFVCSICPVKSPDLELRYDLESHEFHSSSTGYVASSPELGFLYPAFDNRAANIYNALFYSRSSTRCSAWSRLCLPPSRRTYLTPRWRIRWIRTAVMMWSSLYMNRSGPGSMSIRRARARSRWI